MKTLARITAATALVVWLQACENPTRKPAAAALQAAGQALAAVKQEASRFAPAELREVEEALAAAQARFAAGDYAQALAAASGAAVRAQEVGATASQRKAEAGSVFTSMDTFLAEAVNALQARLAELGAMAKQPRELAADALPRAREGLAALRTAWNTSRDSYQAGALAEAARQVTGLPERAQELKALLGMEDGAAPEAR
jgi:hypothetical protein